MDDLTQLLEKAQGGDAPAVAQLYEAVYRELTEWQGFVRIADPQGQPVKGIKATLDPGTGDRQ